jgi:hypothetical protein
VIPESTIALARLLGAVVVIALLWFFGDRLVAMVRAPAEAQRDAALGSNAALKAGSEAQNAGVKGLQKAAADRQAKSKAAVEAAGKPHAARAEAIVNAPPVGATDYERAMNRIDRELGLQ